MTHTMSHDFHGCDSHKNRIEFMCLLVGNGILHGDSYESSDGSHAYEQRLILRPDASEVVFLSSASPLSGCHSPRRLRPDPSCDLTHIPPPTHISCSSHAPYLTSSCLFSCLASQQHPDASPRYPYFLLLLGLLIRTCRRYHSSHSCR